MTVEMQYTNGGNKVNLYFAGSSHNLASKWINELQLPRLFSQELNRPEIAKMIERKKSGEYHADILIDSGAFTAHTKGISVDVDEYIEYLNSITEYVTCYAQVDCIPGTFGKPKTPQELAEAPGKSWENYLYMRPKLKEPEKLLPVYHQGEHIKWLRNMLEWVDENGNHIPYIGISPANDKSQKEKDAFIHMCFDEIKKSSNPNVKTHAFGMTNLSTLSQYPFTSADSTSWALTAVNGGIMSKFGVIGMSAQSKNSNSYKGKSAHDRSVIDKYISDNGFDVNNLIEAPLETVIARIQNKLEPNTVTDKQLEYYLKKNVKPDNSKVAEVLKFEKGRSIKGEHDYKAYLERIRWNIHYLNKWFRSYEYKPKAGRRKKLF